MKSHWTVNSSHLQHAQRGPKRNMRQIPQRRCFRGLVHPTWPLLVLLGTAPRTLVDFAGCDWRFLKMHEDSNVHLQKFKPMKKNPIWIHFCCSWLQAVFYVSKHMIITLCLSLLLFIMKLFFVLVFMFIMVVFYHYYMQPVGIGISWLCVCCRRERMEWLDKWCECRRATVSDARWMTWLWFDVAASGWDMLRQPHRNRTDQCELLWVRHAMSSVLRNRSGS